MSFDYSQEGINDLEKLLVTEMGHDVIIYAGENENIKELHAHSTILCARSQYFCIAFSNVWARKKDGKFIVMKPNISPKLFEIILRFIYCGKIDLTTLLCPEILELLMAVDELNIQALITCVQEYLIKHQDEFLQRNPIEILEIISQYELFTDLWDHCLDKIYQKPEILFDSDELINLKTPLLELILKRDDLILDEIDIWNSLLKWVFAQNSQDITKWSKEEITIVERTLRRFIPSIRFYHISSEDFHDKIYPLKKLLPKDLINDLLSFHITSNVDVIQTPRQTKLIYDSVLIKSKHFAIFASWIDKKGNLHYNVNNIPYDFNLLYRASRDGNTAAAFHVKCDNKGATVVIAKIRNSCQIVGGYNPLFWKSSYSWMKTKESFIFLFANRNNLQSAKVGYSNGDTCSIGCFSGNGPVFGSIWGCGLYFDKIGNWRCDEPCSYPRIDGMQTGDFNVDDYEVFQVIKK